MTDFEALRVDRTAVDDDLLDAGNCGPELAHLAATYLRSPRALIFRHPSSDWRLFAILLPIGSRLSLMRNPIFGQLARAWGLNLRFVGIDRHGLVHDFRKLLSDRTITLLIDWLSGLERDGAHGDLQAADAGLDVLFSALADEMLTLLERGARTRYDHLDLGHRLEPGVAATLFDRKARYPDFARALREALRNEIIDVHFYGRVLRSMDLRETAAEQRIAAQIEAAIDPVTMAKLERIGVGRHLGCYNWLRLAPRQAAMRAHVLMSLPALAAFFAEALVPLDALALHEATDDSIDAHDAPADPSEFAPPGSGRRDMDLKRIAARDGCAQAIRWHVLLRRAVDAGQDRAVIETLAARFEVSPNILRRIWRERPAGLGQPPTWQIPAIMSRLDACADREWPAGETDWHALVASAIPAEAL
ncbi:MAG: hypothetical protein R3E48_04195 [Burkholderiaceae bacterium]